MTTDLQNDTPVIHKQRERQLRARRPLMQKALLLPAEHGAWSWLLVPYLVGAIVAPGWSWASLLTLLAGLSAFLLRQPATAWLRIKQGKGRRSNEPVAMFWTVTLVVIGLLSFAMLLGVGLTQLLWLAPPILALLAVYVGVSQINRAQVRNFWLEIAGGAGLAIMAPAAFVAGGGQLDPIGWLLWLLMAAQNCLGVHYVRLRIADTHNRSQSRAAVLASHLLGLLVVALALVLTGTALIACVPFVFFAARALWAMVQARPVPHMKRFGFTEVGIELVAGLWVAFTLLLP